MAPTAERDKNPAPAFPGTAVSSTQRQLHLLMAFHCTGPGRSNEDLTGRMLCCSDLCLLVISLGRKNKWQQPLPCSDFVLETHLAKKKPTVVSKPLTCFGTSQPVPQVGSGSFCSCSYQQHIAIQGFGFRNFQESRASLYFPQTRRCRDY